MAMFLDVIYPPILNSGKNVLTNPFQTGKHLLWQIVHFSRLTTRSINIYLEVCIGSASMFEVQKGNFMKQEKNGYGILSTFKDMIKIRTIPIRYKTFAMIVFDSHQ